jgi:altronate dehydratase small subunit
MPDRYIVVVAASDNVATAIRELEAGETVEVGVGDDVREIEIAEDVPFGHKIAIADIAAGDTITKYGTSIGNATEAIAPGQWVHVHNVESNYGRGDLAGDEATAVSE